jgi:hypothetical protein
MRSFRQCVFSCEFEGRGNLGRRSSEHEEVDASLTDFQVANTWTKITAPCGYAMVTNVKEPENP